MFTVTSGRNSPSSQDYHRTKPQTMTVWFSGTTKITSNENTDITKFSTQDSSSLHPITSAITGASAAISILLVFVIISMCFLILAVLKRRNKSSTTHHSNGGAQADASTSHAHRSPIALRENITALSYADLLENSHNPPEYHNAEIVKVNHLGLSNEELANPFYRSPNERKRSCDEPPKYETISDLLSGETDFVHAQQPLEAPLDDNKDLNYFLLQSSSQNEENPPPIPRRSQSEGNIMDITCTHANNPQAASSMEFSMIGDYFSSIAGAASYLVVRLPTEENCVEEETQLDNILHKKNEVMLFHGNSTSSDTNGDLARSTMDDSSTNELGADSSTRVV